MVESRIGTEEARIGIVRNELAYRLAVAYDEWRYRVSTLVLEDSLLARYVALEPRLAIRQRAGTLGAIDEELLRQKVNFARRKRALSLSHYQAAETELRAIALLPPTLNLRPRPLDIIPPSDMTRDTASAYEQLLRAQKRTLQRESALENELSTQPQISAGYFIQSLEQEYAFQGLTLGVAVPLDRRTAKVRSEQHQLERTQLDNEADGYRQRRDRRLDDLDVNISRLRDAIVGTDAATETGNARLLRIARLQFDQGAIDFLTFSQLTETLLTDQRERLGQLHQLQQLIRERRFLANTQF
ncbi:TolC family protein [Neolewinella antarctica]|uniref:TolC family protein n=1 Tax=Neolewinella antarctica TaxID=442734 RepID=A0ABX0XFD3_9BACT|nr:hypothetical protein [Neolewinella antarctica]NJC28028.1 hypothetical protein [Neolewinella antarctica]